MLNTVIIFFVFNVLFLVENTHICHRLQMCAGDTGFFNYYLLVNFKAGHLFSLNTSLYSSETVNHEAVVLKSIHFF